MKATLVVMESKPLIEECGNWKISIPIKFDREEFRSVCLGLSPSPRSAKSSIYSLIDNSSFYLDTEYNHNNDYHKVWFMICVFLRFRKYYLDEEEDDDPSPHHIGPVLYYLDRLEKILYSSLPLIKTFVGIKFIYDFTNSDIFSQLMDRGYPIENYKTLLLKIIGTVDLPTFSEDTLRVNDVIDKFVFIVYEGIDSVREELRNSNQIFSEKALYITRRQIKKA